MKKLGLSVLLAENCPDSCQCFENSTNNKRLIVPPLESSFEICDALPNNECTDEQKSTGITMLVKNDANEWVSGDNLVLDGKVSKMENGAEIEVSSIAVSRTLARYVKRDGVPVLRKHRSIYLPANVILLRQ